MKVIGLTGGIGTGKSTVSQYLQDKGYTILDADKMARQVTEKDSPSLMEIRRIFGDDVFLPSGELDRKKLGIIVFNDSAKLKALEAITTTVVIAQLHEKIEEYRCNHYDRPVIVDAPLLFECGMEQQVDESWLVIADYNVRLERIMRRDGLSHDEICARISNQMSTDEKIVKADYVIDNSKDLSWLYKQIDILLERLEGKYEKQDT